MRKGLATGFAIIAGLLIAAPAQAGDTCRKGKNCYELVETPPVYGTIHEQVLVAPARRVKHKVPAVLQDISEEVVVREARTVARHIPAEYGVVEEKVVVHPGGKVWQVTTDKYGRTKGCWVKTKPVYGVVHKRVKVRAARVVHEHLPAITKTRTRTVVLEPARTEVEHIPAQYATRSRTVKVADGHREWRASGGSAGCGRGLFQIGCN